MKEKADHRDNEDPRNRKCLIIIDNSPEKCRAGLFYLGVYTVHHLPEDLEPSATGYPPDIKNNYSNMLEWMDGKGEKFKNEAKIP